MFVFARRIPRPRRQLQARAVLPLDASQPRSRGREDRHVPLVANLAVQLGPPFEVRSGLVPAPLQGRDQSKLELAHLRGPEVASLLGEVQHLIDVTFRRSEIADLELDLFERIDRLDFERGSVTIRGDRASALCMFEAPIETRSVGPGDREPSVTTHQLRAVP